MEQANPNSQSQDIKGGSFDLFLGKAGLQAYIDSIRGIIGDETYLEAKTGNVVHNLFEIFEGKVTL